jgi:CBS domain-containing protein
MQLREIMTAEVVTADEGEEIRRVARLMRDRAVGSVIICDPEGAPAAMITDRDVALALGANGVKPDDQVDAHATRPLVSGDPEMDLEEAAALMVQHRIRRLPVVEGGTLRGIVTLDDIAVRTGNLEVAQRMTADVIQGALPEFYFHERG